MAGYDFEFYETGTISVGAGQKAFSGTGTAWKIRGCEGALIIVAGSGAVNFVSTLTTDATGEFRTAWTGPTLANAQYTMWLPSAVAATALANHQRLAEIIASIQGAQPESANLTALAGLSGNTQTLVRFLEDGSFDLINSSNVGIQDPKGSLGKLAALTLGDRQILQTDTTGALKAFALLANKFLRTDANGDLALSDLGTAAIALLNLSGTAAADRLPYLTGANGADLTILTAFARSILDDANGAAMFATMGSEGTNAENGYIKLPDGTIFQWGRRYNAVGDFDITRPIQYPTACYMTVAVVEAAAYRSDFTGCNVAGATGRSIFSIHGRRIAAGGAITVPSDITVSWLSIGR